MKFFTISGSSYEVDQARKLIRRLKGATPETRVGTGDWKPFMDITDILIGTPVLVSWDYSGLTLRTTLTSQVVSIDPLD